jgi:hypothetical protein
VDLLIPQTYEKTNYLLNQCTLDNVAPLAFLVCHTSLQHKSNPGEPYQKAIDKLMKMFSETLKSEEQILVAIDLIAQRRNLKEFGHLKLLIKSCIDSTRLHEYLEQMLHIACRYDHVALLNWLISQKELQQHLNTCVNAEYTPLLTATFYNSATCVKALLEV